MKYHTKSIYSLQRILKASWKTIAYLENPNHIAAQEPSVQNPSRRRILKWSAIGLGVAVITCGGIGLVGTLQPAVQLPEKTIYGDQTKMNSKVLVTCATKAGSTASVAQAIAATLSAEGAAVDLLPLKDVKDLSAYRAVVLGSAIRFGAWLPEAVQFVEKNQAILNQLPSAFFTVHLMNLGQDEASRKARTAYLDPVRKLVTPRMEAFFAGVGNWSKVSFLEGLISKMVKAPEGDFRDWDAIRAWAGDLSQNGFAAA